MPCSGSNVLSVWGVKSLVAFVLCIKPKKEVNGPRSYLFLTRGRFAVFQMSVKAMLISHGMSRLPHDHMSRFWRSQLEMPPSQIESNEMQWGSALNVTNNFKSIERRSVGVGCMHRHNSVQSVRCEHVFPVECPSSPTGCFLTSCLSTVHSFCSCT